MAKFCRICGTPLVESAVFCGGCGKAIGSPAPKSTAPSVPQSPISVAPLPPPPSSVTHGVPPPPRPAPSHVQPAPRPGFVFETPPPPSAATNQAPPPPSAAAYKAPPPPGSTPLRVPPAPGPGSVFGPPPPVSNAFGGGLSNLKGASGGLPPSPPLWGFQQKLIPIGESLASGLGPNPKGAMKVLSRIIRATFLDPSVARQAALDENGTGEAILAIVLTAVPGIVLGWLGASSIGFGILSAMISTVLMSLVSLGIMVGLLSALSLSLLGVKLGPGQLLRALAYSQGANVLSFVPSIGRLLALWTTVTGVAAVREISGGETQKVAIFMIVGAVAAVFASMFIGPVIYGVLSIF